MLCELWGLRVETTYSEGGLSREDVEASTGTIQLGPYSGAGEGGKRGVWGQMGVLERRRIISN